MHLTQVVGRSDIGRELEATDKPMDRRKEGARISR